MPCMDVMGFAECFKRNNDDNEYINICMYTDCIYILYMYIHIYLSMYIEEVRNQIKNKNINKESQVNNTVSVKSVQT